MINCRSTTVHVCGVLMLCIPMLLCAYLVVDSCMIRVMIVVYLVVCRVNMEDWIRYKLLMS